MTDIDYNTVEPYYIVYKVTCKFCENYYVENTQNKLKIMEQNLQDVDQKVLYDNNLDNFAANFAKTLHTN